MATLTAKDAVRVLRFVAEAESVDEDQPFTGEFLTKLGELVQADWIGYDELDLVRREPITWVELPGNEYDVPFPDPLMWSYFPEAHPTRNAHWRGHVGALKISDFLSRRDLRSSPLYDYLRLFGVEHSLEVQLSGNRWRTKVFSFDRFGGRDFTERDRLVLDLLQPHLARLWRDARTRRLLRQALAELDRANEADPQGVILLGAGTEIEFASPSSRRLLSEFFPAETAGRLPAAIADWVDSGAAEPLSRRRGARILAVSRTNGSLLLEEGRDEVGLTAREREVLAWVARGKTNAQIAELLWLAPSTVRKHLENVYAKLGVNTRTAAVASFLGLLDAEAS